MLDFSWAWGRIAPCDEGRRIRTPVGISQQILSLPRLTAPAFPRVIIKNVRFKRIGFLIFLDGHSNFLTPDPVPNSEVKLVTFVLVLSLMGRYGAVYLCSKKFLVKFSLCEFCRTQDTFLRRIAILLRNI